MPELRVHLPGSTGQANSLLPAKVRGTGPGGVNLRLLASQDVASVSSGVEAGSLSQGDPRPKAKGGSKVHVLVAATDSCC
jgi:hypothetical protein